MDLGGAGDGNGHVSRVCVRVAARAATGRCCGVREPAAADVPTCERVGREGHDSERRGGEDERAPGATAEVRAVRCGDAEHVHDVRRGAAACAVEVVSSGCEQVWVEEA